MSREKKKGTSGNAKAFITRSKALKKLQLSLEEFRRLCILKGIYPRDPKKKFEGSDKTYYLRKDIEFLAHERLISTIRAQNAHRKKVVKAKGSRRIDELKRLLLNKPKARLDHLVLERYPNFEDAIRDLDDPLCLVGLFANLPADRRVGIVADRVTNCQRLLKEFHQYVAREKALKRVFVSIKGYYFQAKVAGELVTWVLPHRFNQILPADVDYSVMLTFLQLYECILSFVNFRLYTAANMAYPPKIGRVANASGLELAAVKVEKIENGNGAHMNEGLAGKDHDKVEKVSAEVVEKTQRLAMETLVEEEEEQEEEEQEEDKTANAEGEAPKPGEENESGEKSGEGEKRTSEDEFADGDPISFGVFADKSFVLGREVPYVELEFMLMAAGAEKVTREQDLEEGEGRLAGYTHWIIDRPKIAGMRNMSLEYVQPQFVFDSINAGVMLPSSLYGVGMHLPPHLSPFVTDDDDGGYKPWFKEVVEKIKAGDRSVVTEAAAVVYAQGEAKKKKEEEIEQRKANEKKKSGRRKKNNRNKEKSTGNSDVEMKNGDNEKVPKEGENDEEMNEWGDVKDKHDEASDPKDASTVSKDDATIGVPGDESGEEESEQENEKEEEEGDDDDDDEEGAEDEVVRMKTTKSEEEGKEMARLMLSRKKRRMYERQKREEDARKAVKEKLMKKRKQLETTQANGVQTRSAAKRRRNKK